MANFDRLLSDTPQQCCTACSHNVHDSSMSLPPSQQCCAACHHPSSVAQLAAPKPALERIFDCCLGSLSTYISVCVVLAGRASLGRVGGITHSSQPLHECISLSPYRSLSCSGPTHVKPFSRPANHPHGRRCHSPHSAAPTAALHSPPQHQVVLHMYQPTLLNSLVLETLPMAALNNLPSQHLSTLWQTFAIGWSSFLKQNGARILYAVFATPCAS